MERKLLETLSKQKKPYKSRLTKENASVDTRLYYDSGGLDKYYGLLEPGEKYGVFERKGNRVVVGDSSVYPSAILKDPEKYFTEEIMEKLDWAMDKNLSMDHENRFISHQRS